MATHVSLLHSNTARSKRFPPWAGLTAQRYRLAGARDFRLDLMRGFCVVAMLIDHVGGASWLYGLTGGNRWIVSAGEGFVFLSGLVVGLVYTRKMLRAGLSAATWGLLRRARILYLVTVGMTLSFVGLAAFTDLSLWVDRSTGLGAENWTQLLVGALTLRYAYHGTDILALYTLLLVASPAMLFLLREGCGRWVLIGSWLLWALHALMPGLMQLWPVQNAQFFPLAAWQVLFITGLVIGNVRATAERRGATNWPRAARATAPWILAGAGLLVAVAWIRAANPWDLLPPSSFLPTGLEYEPLATGVWDKVSLGPGRLAAFAMIAAAGYAFVSALWRPIDRLAGWLLIPLGSGALAAYSAHLFLIVVGYNLAVLGFSEPEQATINSVAQLGLVLLVWALLQLPSALRDTGSSLRRALLAPSSGPHPPRRRRHLVRRWLTTAGCLALLLSVLSLSHGSARGAPAGELAGTTASGIESTWPSPHLNEPLVIWGVQALAQPAWPIQVVPVTVPGDDLLVPGFQLALEGPRSYPLRGGQLHPRMFRSAALKGTMPYYIYPPPGYDDTDRRYPVVYLLHGYYGNFMEWAEVGIHQVVDRLILNELIEPMIIVMPEGGQSYFVNHPSTEAMWADAITDELVPEVDGFYRTLPAARFRAVGGLSMGGMGALDLAFQRPDVFGVVGAHSPTLRWDRPEDKWTFGDDEHYRSVNPLYTAQELDGLEALTIWLDVGEEDWGWFTVDDLHWTLVWRGVPHEFRFLAGGHDPEYWVTHQWRYLDFYDRAFRAAQLH